MIRNFCIIAHIDHGKSTLADRLLEVTGTIEKRKMQAQYLDQLELERERGITIKMAPVRMVYLLDSASFVLNLIDTPGHSDFAYEVSRALTAVEGAILLVDAMQGIQAQTLANFRVAKKAGLAIIGAVNKIDLNPPGLDDLILEVADLVGCDPGEIHRVSGKTGAGVPELLKAVIAKIPPPGVNFLGSAETDTGDAGFRPKPFGVGARALVFDSFYDNHKGVIASVRVFDGSLKAGDEALLIAPNERIKIKEVGYFSPQLSPAGMLSSGEIGYIATGIKDPEKIKIGDTVITYIHGPSGPAPVLQLKDSQKSAALPGYEEPKPVVFVSVYPEDGEEYDLLRTSLQKLRLNDASLAIEPDSNEVLGRGFKVGFLGRLHFEIVTERLKREFNVPTVTTFPSVAYRIRTPRGMSEIVNPLELPSDVLEIWEPMVRLEIIMPQKHVNDFFAFQSQFRLKEIETEVVHERVVLHAKMPLAELMSDFDDRLKSATEGFASFSYALSDAESSDMVRVDFLVAGVAVPGLSRLFHRSVYEKEGRKMVERLKDLLPRQQFAQAIQAAALGRVIAREDVPALRKDVTGYLYGGDRTRKMKLWKKQQRGKKKLKERAHVEISPDMFKELLKK